MSNLTYISKCIVPNCGLEFTQGPPLIGEEAPARMHRMLNKLAEHLQKRHPNEWQQITQQGKGYASLMSMFQFEFQDPFLNNFRDACRHGFFKSLQVYKVTDQMIVERCTALQLPDEFRERVTNSHVAMRNVLEEIAPPEKAPADPMNGQPASSAPQ